MEELVQVWLPRRGRNKGREKEVLDKRLRAASGLGYLQVSSALLKMGADVDSRDPKTGWTALHWAASRRQLHVISFLLSQNASLRILDNAGNTPFDLLAGSSMRHGVVPCELYTWNIPSTFDTGRAASAGQKDANIVMSSIHFLTASVGTYHSVAVAQDRSVYAWGHGENFRFGYDCSVLHEPRPIPDRIKAMSISASRLHSALVNTKGKLFTWGEGSEGQLGLGPKMLVSPLRLVIAPSIKDEKFKLVVTSDYHTCALSDSGHLFTFGRGLEGQLGHSTFEKEFYPRMVPLTNSVISQVCCSNTITAIVNQKHDVYWFGAGNPRPSRIRFIFGYPSLHRPSMKVLSIAASLDTLFILAFDPEDEKPLYKFYKFTPSIASSPSKNGRSSGVTPPSPGSPEKSSNVLMAGIAQEISFNFQLYVPRSISCNDDTLFILTEMGQVFIGHIDDGLETIRLVQAVYSIRPTSLSVGSRRRLALVPVPLEPDPSFLQPVPSTLQADLKALYADTASMDAVVLLPDGTQLRAHAFVLARSPVIRKAFTSGLTYFAFIGGAAVWNALIHYLYTNVFPLDERGRTSSHPKCEYIGALRNLCENIKLTVNFGATPENAMHSGGFETFYLSNADGPEKFPTNIFQTDLTLSHPDGAIRTNRALLFHRCEFFKVMFSNWMEGSLKIVPISEDVPFLTLRALVGYLYTNTISVELSISDLANLLLLADSYLLPHLKHLVSVEILSRIDVVNAVNMIQLAEAAATPDLKNAATHYVARNLHHFLPNLFSDLSPEDLEELQAVLKGSPDYDYPPHYPNSRNDYLIEFERNLHLNAERVATIHSSTEELEDEEANRRESPRTNKPAEVTPVSTLSPAKVDVDVRPPVPSSVNSEIVEESVSPSPLRDSGNAWGKKDPLATPTVSLSDIMKEQRAPASASNGRKALPPKSHLPSSKVVASDKNSSWAGWASERSSLSHNAASVPEPTAIDTNYPALGGIASPPRPTPNTRGRAKGRRRGAAIAPLSPPTSPASSPPYRAWQKPTPASPPSSVSPPSLLAIQQEEMKGRTFGSYRAGRPDFASIMSEQLIETIRAEEGDNIS